MICLLYYRHHDDRRHEEYDRRPRSRSPDRREHRREDYRREEKYYDERYKHRGKEITNQLLVYYIYSAYSFLIFMENMYVFFKKKFREID